MGETVEVLADDYTSKGDEELIEVKIGDDIIFVEKKFISLKPDALASGVEEDFNVPAVNSVSGVANVKESDDDDDDDEDYDDDDEEFIISLDDLDDIVDDTDDDDEEDDEPVDLINIDTELNNDDEDDTKISISDLNDIPAPTGEAPTETERSENDLDTLQAKLRKSLEELEDVRAEMKNTFTSTDTISGTITSIKGMLDALKKDTENLK